MGLILPRDEMASWMIRCCQEWLEPLYWQIHEKLVACGVLHMDETRIQCNKENGKKASSESFIWVIRSAVCEEIQAAFFYYSPTRNGDTAKELLENFYGYLVTDAWIRNQKSQSRNASALDIWILKLEQCSQMVCAVVTEKLLYQKLKKSRQNVSLTVVVYQFEFCIKYYLALSMLISLVLRVIM